MADGDRNGLIHLPSRAVSRDELRGPENIISGMVSDAIALLRTAQKPLSQEINDCEFSKESVKGFSLSDSLMTDGITLAGFHIESGARLFSAFTKAMINDLGNGVKPYLKSWYLAVKYDPRAVGFFGMDDEAEVTAFDIESIQPDIAEQTNRSISSHNDALYQRARVIYDNLTDNGGTTWVGDHSRFGLPQSLLEIAFRVFKNLAERGYGKAYFPLSKLYGGMQSVDGDVLLQEKFKAMALEWCLENCHQKDPEIWNDLGHLYLHKNYRECYNWWTKASYAEHPWGLWNLMGMYENGCGACEQDYDEALRLQIRAAETGNLSAIHGLIDQYDFGGSPIQDDMLAKHWRQRAQECESALQESLAQDLEGFR